MTATSAGILSGPTTLRRIPYFFILPHHRAARQLGGVNMPFAHDVEDLHPTRKQVIRDDAAMTAPPHGFGAHAHATLLATALTQRGQALVKIRRQCVIGVVVKAIVVPE